MNNCNHNTKKYALRHISQRLLHVMKKKMKKGFGVSEKSV